MTSLTTRDVSVRHIVWDWNGTLFDDNHAVVSAVNTVCTEFGRDPIDLPEWRAVFTRPLQDCYERLLRRSLDDVDWARIDTLYHDAYRDLLDTCGLASGVPDMLHQWTEQGRSQSLLSMWFHSELVPLVTQLGLHDVFDRVDGVREDVGGGTKDTHLEQHLEVLGRAPEEVVLVGDVLDDAYAAERVGTNCVLLTTGVMSREKLETAGYPVVDSIEDALGQLA